MNFFKTSALTSCLVLSLSVVLLIGCKPIFEKKPIPAKDDQAASAPAPAPAPESAPLEPIEPIEPIEPTESVMIEDVQSLQTFDPAENDIDTITTDIEMNVATEPVADDGDDIVKPDAAMIRDIQQALVDAGFNPGPVDGKSGGKTVAAIEAFQKENGIAPGKINKRTLRALGVEF